MQNSSSLINFPRNYNKVQLSCSSNVEISKYCWCHQTTIVSSDSNQNISENAKKARHCISPMNSDFGVELFTAVEQAIKIYSTIVSRITFLEDGEQWIGYQHWIDVDKPGRSLNLTGLKFYPIHLTGLSFKQRLQRKRIASGNTPTAYLHVCVENSHSVFPDKRQLRDNRKSKEPRACHECLELVTKAPEKVWWESFPTRSKYNSKVCSGYLLASYVRDIPEVKGALSVKYGVLKSFTCPCCLTITKFLSENVIPKLCNLSEPIEALTT